MKSRSALILSIALAMLITVASPVAAKVKNPDPRPEACYTSTGQSVAPLPNGKCPPGTVATDPTGIIGSLAFLDLFTKHKRN